MNSSGTPSVARVATTVPFAMPNANAPTRLSVGLAETNSMTARSGLQSRTMVANSAADIVGLARGPSGRHGEVRDADEVPLAVEQGSGTLCAKVYTEDAGLHAAPPSTLGRNSPYSAIHARPTESTKRVPSSVQPPAAFSASP